MPIFWDMYENDPDYLGALTMWDMQVGHITLKWGHMVA